MLVAYEANDPKELKVLRKQGASIPHVAVMYGSEVHRGYLVNGGKDDDQVLIEIYLGLLPSGALRDTLASGMQAAAADSSVEGYVDLLAGEEGPDAVRGVVEFAMSLALGDAYFAAGGDPTSGSVEVAEADPLDQLKKLGELHSAGVLTDEEFAAKKAELLRKL
jgi:hypothetical protein